MSNILNRILRLLNFGRRDGVVLLLALLLAFSVWLIHKLSLEYSVYLNVEVVAESNIQGRSDKSSSGVEIMARCRTTGWRILYAYFTRDKVVHVNIPETALRYDEEDRYYITSERLHEYADKIFGSSVSVENFVSDKVYFKFQKEDHKVLPVKPVSSISFEDQYIANSDLQTVPEYVTVYGDEMHLEALEYVTTATIKHSSVKEGVSGMISLTPIKGMRFSVNEVHYKMDVTRYVEIESKRVPVEVINIPPGKDFYADPLYVDVKLKCEFPLKSNPNKGLYLVADYEEYMNSISGNVVVRPSAVPFGTLSYDISPIFVQIKEERR